MELRDQGFEVGDEVYWFDSGLVGELCVVTKNTPTENENFPITVTLDGDEFLFTKNGQWIQRESQSLFHREAVTIDEHGRLTAINHDYVKERAPKVVTKEPSEFEPFEKVLVRDRKFEKWECALFSHRDEDDNAQCIGGHYLYCIPFAGNEHLVGKVTD